MAHSVEIVRRYCIVSEAEEALLLFARRPVVLLARKPDSNLPDAVAPGVGTLGFMLPYTPLHHLLLEDLERPLVMTSGNVSDEPICYEDGDARPLYLSAAFIIEEGLPMKELRRILVSMREAADEAGVSVVMGDTKVVQKGGADRIFINTDGIGVVESPVQISAARASDAGAVHCLRDPTRGGVATTLNEIALGSEVCIEIEEDRIIGEVKAEPQGIVAMRTGFGGTRIVDMLVGE